MIVFDSDKANDWRQSIQKLARSFERGEVARVRSTLQHYVNRADGIGSGVRNVRNTVQTRVRARRDVLNGFTSTGGSSSVFSRANMRTIQRTVITIRFPALSPLINGFIDKLGGK